MRITFVMHGSEVLESQRVFVQNLTGFEVKFAIRDCAARSVYSASYLDRLVVPKLLKVVNYVLVLRHVVEIEHQKIVLVQ